MNERKKELKKSEIKKREGRERKKHKISIDSEKLVKVLIDTAVWMHMDANYTYGEKAWLQLHKNVASNVEQVLEAVPTKQQLYGHLPLITKTIQFRRTRHTDHCWRSRDEHISDILLWTPSHGQATAGRPARTYIQQLCADTGCSLDHLLGAMYDREGWWERVREIRAGSTTWWWWWLTDFNSMSAILSFYAQRLGKNVHIKIFMSGRKSFFFVQGSIEYE